MKVGDLVKHVDPYFQKYGLGIVLEIEHSATIPYFYIVQFANCPDRFGARPRDLEVISENR